MPGVSRARPRGKARTKLRHASPVKRNAARIDEPVRVVNDEEITSSSEDEQGLDDVPKKRTGVNLIDEEEPEETAQEKRLRLTKKYLDEVAEVIGEDLPEAESELHDAISHRLRDETLEKAGKLRRTLVDKVKGGVQTDGIRTLRCKEMKLSPTCLVVSSDDKSVFAGSKDGTIAKWDVTSGKRLAVIKKAKKTDGGAPKMHSSSILALDISSDGKFLVAGESCGAIFVWSPDDLSFIHRFKGHRGAVTGLAFRKGTHELYSVSKDRSLSVWNLDEMTYVETMFGHQDAVQGISALSRPRAVTCGGRDSTLRVWKIVEESHLVYNGNPEEGSIDCLAVVNDETFVSGSEAGCLSLWRVLKKKPVQVIPEAHGKAASNGLPNWICSLTALHNTDLVASAGSGDGAVRVWALSQDQTGKESPSLTAVLSFPIAGFVNAMRFSSSGDALICAVGQEHRLGRWWRDKKAKNSVVVLPLVPPPS